MLRHLKPEPLCGQHYYWLYLLYFSKHVCQEPDLMMNNVLFRLKVQGAVMTQTSMLASVAFMCTVPRRGPPLLVDPVARRPSCAPSGARWPDLMATPVVCVHASAPTCQRRLWDTGYAWSVQLYNFHISDKIRFTFHLFSLIMEGIQLKFNKNSKKYFFATYWVLLALYPRINVIKVHSVKKWVLLSNICAHIKIDRHNYTWICKKCA